MRFPILFSVSLFLPNKGQKYSKTSTCILCWSTYGLFQQVGWRKRERERTQERLHPDSLSHRNGCKSLDWFRLKPGATPKAFKWLVGTQARESSSAASRSSNRNLDPRWRGDCIPSTPLWDVHVPSSTTVLAPLPSLLFYLDVSLPSPFLPTCSYSCSITSRATTAFGHSNQKSQ